MTQKFISPEKSEKSSGWSKTDSKQSVRSTKENGFHTVRKGDRKALSPDPKLMSPPAKSIKSYDYMSPQATSTKLTESKKDRLRSPIYTKENKNQDISVICLDEKMGLTNDDLYEHLVHNHELISIEELIREVNTVLNGVELNCKDLLQQKNKMLKACEDHKNFIEYDKSQFLKVQRKKIDELHDYLEKKYSNIIVEYNKSIEKDLLNISNNKNRIIREIEENIKYINEVKKVKDSFLNSYIEEEGNFKFKEPNRLKIIRNFLKARKFFIDYKKMKRDFEKKIITFKSVFDSEVLNQKSSLSVEYDTYIEEVYKKIMEVPTVKNSLEIYDGTKMDEKNIPKEKIKRMPQARKIRIPRWNTMLIAEYEIDNKFWTSSECNSDIPFFPFCGIVYLPNKSIVIMGGFNDKVENRKTFSSKVLRVEEKKINFLESRYITTELKPMKTKRGCMTACCTGDKIFVCGGIYHEDTILKKCEVYDVATDTWSSIKSMHLKRKDASSVAMNGELIYVFGGSSPEENTIDTIEKYNIKNNEWEIIPCKLPFFMSGQITLRVSSRTILILGGNIIGKDGYVRRSPKVFRLFTDTNFLQEEVPLPKPALSIYPGFVDNTNLMIVDEDSNYEQPSIVVYSIALFIPGFTSDQENTE